MGVWEGLLLFRPQVLGGEVNFGEYQSLIKFDWFLCCLALQFHRRHQGHDVTAMCELSDSRQQVLVGVLSLGAALHRFPGRPPYCTLLWLW